MLWGQIPGPYGLVSPILPRVVALNRDDGAVFEGTMCMLFNLKTR